MKIRDSGMPEEAYWETLFDVPLILERLAIARCCDVAELGCGYGTFTVPIAKAISGTLHAFDVDPAMIARTRQRAGSMAIAYSQRDVVADGFNVTVDGVLLFNILHCEQPIELFFQAAKALKRDGQVYVIHWRYGETPRGPSLDIRPKPEQIVEWAQQAGLTPTSDVIDLPPWHYGLRFGLA
jgi:SAM-dependent methyltransferase